MKGVRYKYVIIIIIDGDKTVIEITYVYMYNIKREYITLEVDITKREKRIKRKKIK